MLGMKRLIDVSRAIETLAPIGGTGIIGWNFSVRSENGPALDPEQEGVTIDWHDSPEPHPTAQQIRDTMSELEEAEELRIVKEVRDSIIARSDWTELPSVQAVNTAEWKKTWADHRQTLRDLPNKMMENAVTTHISGKQGESTITVDNATGIQANFQLSPSGVGIATGAYVTAVNGNVLTLSLPNTNDVNCDGVFSTWQPIFDPQGMIFLWNWPLPPYGKRY